MWKEYMVKLSQNSDFVKVNNPAEITEVTEAESVLGINFPDDYRQCLMEINGNDDCLYSIRSMVELNILMKELYPEDNYLRVGGNGCGDDIFYRIKDGSVNSSELYMWWHEDDMSENEPFASNLMEAIVKLYSE